MKIETKIAEMLKENTGTHFLDSGQDNNRAWQRNQSRDFAKEPVTTVDIYKDDMTISLSTYHFLISHLELDDKTDKYNKMYDALYKDSEEAHLADMEDFASMFEPEGTTNTYNFENTLDQTLQYTMFNDNDDDTFIILQIHGGCDVRGGYTKPYIFYLPDSDYFYMNMTNVTCHDKKTGNAWDSDNCGYDWHPSNDEHNLIISYKNKKAYDKKTRNELYFYINLDW